MTENIETMCRTLGEMLPQELDAKKDAFVLCVCSKEGEQQIMISFGMIENLATAWVVGILKMVEQIPVERLRGPIVRGIADTLVHQWEEDHGEP